MTGAGTKPTGEAQKTASFGRADLVIRNGLILPMTSVGKVFTGDVVRPTCFREGKLAAASGFAEAHDVELSSSYFYTDSSDDLPLLEAVDTHYGDTPSAAPARELLQSLK